MYFIWVVAINYCLNNYLIAHVEILFVCWNRGKNGQNFNVFQHYFGDKQFFFVFTTALSTSYFIISHNPLHKTFIVINVIKCVSEKNTFSNVISILWIQKNKELLKKWMYSVILSNRIVLKAVRQSSNYPFLVSTNMPNRLRKYRSFTEVAIIVTFIQMKPKIA